MDKRDLQELLYMKALSALTDPVEAKLFFEDPISFLHLIALEIDKEDTESLTDEDLLTVSDRLKGKFNIKQPKAKVIENKVNTVNRGKVNVQGIYRCR